jgi:hypothetical protein
MNRWIVAIRLPVVIHKRRTVCGEVIEIFSKVTSPRNVPDCIHLTIRQADIGEFAVAPFQYVKYLFTILRCHLGRLAP